MKMNKKQLILTSFVIVLPALIGAFFWKALPEQIPTHFGIDGQADGYSSKLFTLVAFPILFVLFQIIALASLERVSVKVTVPAKMRKLYAWIIPCLSLIVQLSIYANALGVVKSSPTLVTAFLGMLFIVIGNYLPKTKRNYTIGIRLPWTLSDDRNWFKTHRLAGKIWVLGGVIVFLDSFVKFALPYVLGISLVVMIVLPILYSFSLSRKLK
ncbi:SdpI family protein [Streptococcus sp. SL1232]|uniref:SdpI family protein n=1 Tax=Streptococcus vicugnae TaxID=2740579 RepID=A0A4R5G4K5_9STRE|nr:SdpI family protein [Streptococcus vicugnae]MBJ7540444.1 SdpI family protein [Streptococcus vicugnae]TDE72752.1 SdpI family protein [Streptococcus vicugnae]